MLPRVLAVSDLSTSPYIRYADDRISGVVGVDRQYDVHRIFYGDRKKISGVNIMAGYYIYMLRCKDHSLYTGITTDVQKRMKEHFSGDKRCAKYTLTHPPEKLEAVWSCADRSQASKLEYWIKKLPRQKKEQLLTTGELQVLEEKIDVSVYKFLAR